MMDRPLHLVLLRHAKSDWSHPELADFDRPLNARGRREAPRLGAALAPWGVQRVICSAAARARETWAAMAPPPGDPALHFSEDLYMGGIEALQAELLELPPEVTCVLVIGHNPGLEEAILWLTGRACPLKTASAAILQGPAPWGSLAPQSWVLTGQIHAKNLR